MIVREQESYRYLTKTLGLTENVHLAADPAFLMEPVPLEESIWARTGRTTLAVNLSAGCIAHVFGEDRVSAMRDEYTGMLAELISSKSADILLVPHVSADHSLLRPTYETLRNQFGESVSLLPPGIGAPATKWAVSQCDALVTMRFHCALAGIGTCTPTVILLSTDKGRKLALDVYEGREDSLLPIRDMTGNSLLEKVESVLERGKSEQDFLRRRLGVMRKRSLSAGDVLKQVVAES